MRYCLLTALLLLSACSEAQVLSNPSQQQLRPANNPYLSADRDEGAIAFTETEALLFLSDQYIN